MAIFKTNMVDIDLAKGQIHRSFLNHSIGTQDQQADRFGIRVFRDGEEADLTGVTVQGVFMPPQGAPIAITGSTYTSIDGNTAEVILPQACYNYEGNFTLAIKLVDATNAVTGTMRIVDGMVDNTHASGTVAPTGNVPTYQEVLAVYDELLQDVTDYESVVANQNAKIDDLKNALITENIVQVDDTIRKTKGFYIDATTKLWKKLATAEYSIIKVKAGDSLNLTAGGSLTYIAVMKSYTNPAATDDPVDYSDSTGFTTLISVTKNTTYTATLPADAEYLYIYLGTSSNVRTPASVIINGYDYTLPFFENFSTIITDITEDIDTIKSTYTAQNALASAYSNLLSHIVDVGVYYIASNQAFTDRPAYIRTNVAESMTVSMYASTMVKQEIVNARGQKATRLVTKSNFTPYTTGITTDEYGWFYSENINSRWANKKIVCFGDSRTWYDGKTYGNRTKEGISGTTCIGYQEQMRILLGATLTNEGVSGEKSTAICERIRAYNFTNYDAVLLEGGVNDYIKSSSVTIGELQPIGSTFDTTTVYGAWQSAIEYLMANYPLVKIFITVPAIAWDDTNTMGTVFPYSVASIKKEVAELYMLPVLDLYKTAGITTVNRDAFYCDDVSQTDWRLHFNNDGNVLIGQMIAEYIITH